MSYDRYKYIKFPFYGWKKKPISIRENNKGQLLVKRRVENTEAILDDTNLPGDYGQRLAQLPTQWGFILCNNVDSIIFNGVRWGLDREGEIRNFSDPVGANKTKKEHSYRRAKVLKIKDKKVYVEGIPYPINIPVDVNIPIEDLYVYIMTADGRWRIKSFYTPYI